MADKFNLCSLFFHEAVVQIFRPFAHTKFLHQFLAKQTMLASMSQMQRILYIQRHQYGGLPFSSATAGSLRVFTSEILEAAGQVGGCGYSCPVLYDFGDRGDGTV